MSADTLIANADFHNDCDVFVDKFKDGRIGLIIPPNDIPAFIKLLRRGLNTWDSAPPNMKALGDMVEHDRVLQNYWEQDSSK